MTHKPGGRPERGRAEFGLACPSPLPPLGSVSWRHSRAVFPNAGPWKSASFGLKRKDKLKPQALGPLMWHQWPGAAARVHGFQISRAFKNHFVLLYAQDPNAKHAKATWCRVCLPCASHLCGSQISCNSLPRFSAANVQGNREWPGVRPCRLEFFVPFSFMQLVVATALCASCSSHLMRSWRSFCSSMHTVALLF